MLKRRLSLLLLLGALLGLFGQEMAYAAGPGLARTMAGHVMPDGADCRGMASAYVASHEEPCKGLTLACIARMGCIVPMTFAEPARLMERIMPRQLAATWPTLPALVGLALAPEPEPPSA